MKYNLSEVIWFTGVWRLGNKGGAGCLEAALGLFTDGPWASYSLIWASVMVGEGTALFEKMLHTPRRKTSLRSEQSDDFVDLSDCSVSISTLMVQICSGWYTRWRVVWYGSLVKGTTQSVFTVANAKEVHSEPNWIVLLSGCTVALLHFMHTHTLHSPLLHTSLFVSCHLPS